MASTKLMDNKYAPPQTHGYPTPEPPAIPEEFVDHNRTIQEAVKIFELLKLGLKINKLGIIKTMGWTVFECIISGKQKNLWGSPGQLHDYRIFGHGMSVMESIVSAVKNVKQWQRKKEAYGVEMGFLDLDGKEVSFPEFETLEELKLKLLVRGI
jgi:hypothetical protein